MSNSPLMAKRSVGERFRHALVHAWRNRTLLLMFLPILIFYLLFSYAPMFNPRTGGILMAFKKSRLNQPFSSWDWVGLQYFRMLFSKPDFWVAMKNTLLLSFLRLLVEFPVPIILALLLNEVRVSKAKRVFQTVYTFPHFLSWVLVVGIMKDLLQMDGILNGIKVMLGGEAFNFLANGSRASNYAMLIISSMLKGMGWSAIIYLSTIAGIDPTLYEAAAIDGATRFQRMQYITWPSIKPTVIILLILAVGGILDGSFDQIFNLVNGINRNVIETIDVYIYRYAFQQSINQSFSAASGLFKSVVSFAMLITANIITRRLSDDGEAAF
ncbi:MAG: ABC transporter permease subunit [Bacillota bacterium]|nr:ABC transporter permease subunit [Bacillota bacterium]